MDTNAPRKKTDEEQIQELLEATGLNNPWVVGFWVVGSVAGLAATVVEHFF